MADDTLAVLTKAAQGLLYPSETDAPFEPFVWESGPNTVASMQRLSGQAADDPCRTVSLEDFLGDLAEEKEFAELQAVLQKTLTGIKVYRCGTVSPTYYVVGADASGRLAGLKTHAVET
jgi:hypothetical protein